MEHDDNCMIINYQTMTLGCSEPKIIPPLPKDSFNDLKRIDINEIVQHLITFEQNKIMYMTIFLYNKIRNGIKQRLNDNLTEFTVQIAHKSLSSDETNAICKELDILLKEDGFDTKIMREAHIYAVNDYAELAFNCSDQVKYATHGTKYNEQKTIFSLYNN